MENKTEITIIGHVNEIMDEDHNHVKNGIQGQDQVGVTIVD